MIWKVASCPLYRYHVHFTMICTKSQHKWNYWYCSSLAFVWSKWFMNTFLYISIELLLCCLNEETSSFSILVVAHQKRNGTGIGENCLYVSIVSGDGLMPVRHQAIIWTNVYQDDVTRPQWVDCGYCKTSNIRRTLVANKIVDHSDVVGASPVGAAPTTSSFST